MKFTHNPSVKFLYLKNKNDPEQVLCVGRVIRDGYMLLSTSLNHGLDKFDKAKARHIVSERLRIKRSQVYRIPIPPPGKKTETIVNFLSTELSVPREVRWVAEQYADVVGIQTAVMQYADAPSAQVE